MQTHSDTVFYNNIKHPPELEKCWRKNNGLKSEVFVDYESEKANDLWDHRESET